MYVAAAPARRVDHVLRDRRALQQHARLAGCCGRRSCPCSAPRGCGRARRPAAPATYGRCRTGPPPRRRRGSAAGRAPSGRPASARASARRPALPEPLSSAPGAGSAGAGEVDRVEVRGDEHDVARLRAGARPVGDHVAAVAAAARHRLGRDRVARLRERGLGPGRRLVEPGAARCGGCGARRASPGRRGTRPGERAEQRDDVGVRRRRVRPGSAPTRSCARRAGGAPSGSRRAGAERSGWRDTVGVVGTTGVASMCVVGVTGCGHRSRSTSSPTSVTYSRITCPAMSARTSSPAVAPRPGLGAAAAGRAVVEAPVAVEGQPLPAPRRRERVVRGSVHADVARLLLLGAQPGAVRQSPSRPPGAARRALAPAPSGPAGRPGRRPARPRSGRENSSAACMRATWPSVNMTMVSSST